MNRMQKLLTAATVAAMLCTSLPAGLATQQKLTATAAGSAANTMEWGTLEISGGGFVSGIVTGQNVMYARTDVGGAYRYDYDTQSWVQLMAATSEPDKGYLSVDAIAIDPTDDDTVYMLCGCAYFSNAKTAVYRSINGGDNWDVVEITDLVQVHGNGYGRQCGESIAVDPDDPSTLYCGGDTEGLIVSHDYGKTWDKVTSFDTLGLFTEEIKWPTWTDHMVKATASEYAASNGISTIAIQDGKVYVGVSVTGVDNLYVADVGKDNWKVVSADLPNTLYPSRINLDANGDLLIGYVPTLTFGSSGGGAYRYDKETGTVTDISPKANTPFGSIVSEKDNADHLVASTCGVWYSQLWAKDDWDNDCVAWGDITFRSEDGGKTWRQMAPGNEITWSGPLQADYLQDGGVSWVRNKAIHWSGTVVFDPRDSDRLLITSGNGIFQCQDAWGELPVFSFHAKGIEEVVPLDLVSVPGGNVYSAIGDYDGFIHSSVTDSTQYQPNMGSTGAIAYCKSNPDIMLRYSENESKGYYSQDGGKSWTALTGCMAHSKGAITTLEDGTYRFFCTGEGGTIYSDDFGKTWSKSTGTAGKYITVDPEKPNYVYGAGNDYNAYDTSRKANNYLYVSDDYGVTFTAKTICNYDGAEDYARIAAAGNGTVYCPAGYYGLYKTTDYGETFTKVENIFSCFAVGVGAAKPGNKNLTVYAWANETEGGNSAIFRSTDEAASWECIMDEYHTYGGTGNGKFVVGDMNTYGTVYMSSVGMGIVYGKIGSDTPNPPVTTTTTTTTSTSVNYYGDVNCDNKISIADLVFMARYVAEDAEMTPLSAQGILNADCVTDSKINSQDITALARCLAHLIPESALGPQA